jgi:hypothetical protein
VSAEQFLEFFRGMGGDVYLGDADRVVLDGPPALLAAVRWRFESIRTRELVAVLKCEREQAAARLRARGIEPLHSAATVATS